jgi:hypothetical protein
VGPGAATSKKDQGMMASAGEMVGKALGRKWGCCWSHGSMASERSVFGGGRGIVAMKWGSTY